MPILKLIRTPTLLLLFFLLAVKSLYAQAPVVEWQKCYGGDDADLANCIQQTKDGGYIAVGGSFSGNHTGDVLGHHGNRSTGDIWILKTDVHGNIEWQRSLGGTDQDDAISILQTADGGYIVGGSATIHYCEVPNQNHGEFDFWVLKLNSKGEIIWNKMYGGSGTEIAYAFAASSDGGYYVAGQSFSNDGDVTGNHGSSDFWVIKIDGAGKLIWQKSLGGSNDDIARSVQSTPDGGCIVAGLEQSTDGDITGNHGIGDYWLVKLDKTGKIQWQKTYGGTALDDVYGLGLTKDGGYIMAGYSGSFDGDVTGKIGNYDEWIVKVNNAGAIQWQKCYGGTGNEGNGFLQPTSDGGYVVASYTGSTDHDVTCNSGGGDAWIFKIDNAGDLQWQTSIGGSGGDQISYIQPLVDGSFIAAGNTSSSDIPNYHTPVPLATGYSDYWLVKLSAPQASTPLPTISFNPSSGSVCSNNLFTIRADVSFAGLNPSFQWTRNGIPVGNNSSVYTASDFQENDLVNCTVISGGPACTNAGLSATKSLTIHINNNVINPAIKITADNTFVCDCVTNTFNATVTNPGPSPKYEWQVNGQSTGINLPVFSSNSLKSGDLITCIYTDDAGCVPGGAVVSAPIKMTKSGDGVALTISASADSVCAGAVVIFNADAVNAGANAVYQWRVNNMNVGDNSPTFNTNKLVTGDQVSCVMNITNTCSSVSIGSNTLFPTIGKAPTILIHPGDTLIHKGDQLQLTASITGPVSSFQWVPADKLEDSTTLSPTTLHLTDNTTYTLTATNDEGCTASKSMRAIVFSPFYMPNAFTPNGDGKNDVFRIPPGSSLRLEEFSIYDRWGTRIFSTQNIDKGWDGTINGKQLPTGVFIYVIKGTNGNSVFLKGSVTLIR